MKRILLALFFALSAPVLFVQPALAQFGFGGVVFDPRNFAQNILCLLYTSPSPRDQRGSRMPSSA